MFTLFFFILYCFIVFNGKLFLLFEKAVKFVIKRLAVKFSLFQPFFIVMYFNI